MHSKVLFIVHWLVFVSVLLNGLWWCGGSGGSVAVQMALFHCAAVHRNGCFRWAFA